MKAVTIFLQGVLVGIVIAFPKGPAGFLVINQTILFGPKNGFITAFGPIATTFVSSLIVLYISGLGSYIKKLKEIERKKTVRIISCLILIGVGIYIFYVNNHTSTPSIGIDQTAEISFKLFLMTFLEPTLFPVTCALFIKISPQTMTGDVFMKSVFYTGIVIGTIVFYSGLCSFFNWLVIHDKITDITIISKFVGITFMVCGLVLLLTVLYKARSFR